MKKLLWLVFLSTLLLSDITYEAYDYNTEEHIEVTISNNEIETYNYSTGEYTYTDIEITNQTEDVRDIGEMKWEQTSNY